MASSWLLLSQVLLESGQCRSEIRLQHIVKPDLDLHFYTGRQGNLVKVVKEALSLIMEWLRKLACRNFYLQKIYEMAEIWELCRLSLVKTFYIKTLFNIAVKIC